MAYVSRGPVDRQTAEWKRDFVERTDFDGDAGQRELRRQYYLPENNHPAIKKALLQKADGGFLCYVAYTSISEDMAAYAISQLRNKRMLAGIVLDRPFMQVNRNFRLGLKQIALDRFPKELRADVEYDFLTLEKDPDERIAFLSITATSTALWKAAMYDEHGGVRTKALDRLAGIGDLGAVRRVALDGDLPWVRLHALRILEYDQELVAQCAMRETNRDVFAQMARLIYDQRWARWLINETWDESRKTALLKKVNDKRYLESLLRTAETAEFMDAIRANMAALDVSVFPAGPAGTVRKSDTDAQ